MAEKKLKETREQPKKAYAYMRISGRSQIGKGKYGLITQKEDINEAAKINKISIRRWYDDISTGTNVEREDFQEMTDDLEENPDVKFIIISRMSRLGRNVREILNWYYELEKRGVRLITSDGGIIDTDTSAGKMSFYIQCVFAEIELDTMRAQMTKGLKKYIEKHGQPGKKNKGKTYKVKK